MGENNNHNGAIDTLIGWSEEDDDNRCVMIVASDEERVRMAYNGSRRNLAAALMASILKDEELKKVCAYALAEVDKVVSNEE